MPVQEPPAGGNDHAVLWRALTRTDGALRFRGDRVSGYVFARVGRPYFGVVDGEPPIPADLGTTGIDPAIWEAALTSPEASASLATCLLAHGAPADAVAHFGLSAVTSTLARAGENEHIELSTVRRGHPFGPEFLFEVVASGSRHWLVPVVDESDLSPSGVLLERIRPSRLQLDAGWTVLGRTGVRPPGQLVGESAYSFASSMRAGQPGARGRPRRWRRPR